jgi:protein gp37
MAFLSIEPLLEDVGEVNLSGIDWVIVGGESGAGARPMERAWVVSIQRQCRKYKVPFFFKQWGGVRKSEAGRELNGRTYDDHPLPSRCSMPPLSERKRLISVFTESWPAIPPTKRKRPA